MRSFVDWIKDPAKGFWVKDYWDSASGKMKTGGAKLVLQPHQERILGYALTMQDDGTFPHTRVLYSEIKKSGKALALDTPIPTPAGWTTMGVLEVGDVVFDDQGRPTPVSFTSEVMHGHDCYEIEFSDGSKIVADAEHEWLVGSRTTPGGLERSEAGLYWHVTTTEQMARQVVVPWPSGAVDDLKNYSVRLSPGFDLPPVDLLVPPYTLGAWLGDGNTAGARLTVGAGDEHILDVIQSEGVPVRSQVISSRTPNYGLTSGVRGNQHPSLQKDLRVVGVLGDKHIPDLYLRSSRSQRLELLRGLMDTDGYVSADKGRCEFTTTNRRLANGMRDLLSSLGYKANIIEKRATLYGRDIGPKYRIHFQAYSDEPVFHLERKRSRLKPRPSGRKSTRSELVRVVAITQVESVPVKCIQVDTPNHLYLVGPTALPTHNTTLEAAIACWYADEAPDGTEIYVISNDDDQSKKLVLSDIKYHVNHEVPDAWVTGGKITYPNDTYIQSVAQDYASASGSRHALTLWDELHGYKSEGARRLWSEMTPISTIPGSLQVVTTYAGYEGESELLWEMYLRGVGPEENKDGQGVPLEGFEDLPVWVNGDLFTFWSHDPRMPWQDDAYYERERENSRPADYLRLHENRWVTSHEAFIDPNWWDMAAKSYPASAVTWGDHPYRRWPLYVAVDVAPKHDNSAVAAVAYDPSKALVSLVEHKLWHPIEGEDFDLEATVEAYLLELKRKYTLRKVGYDPYQFHRSMVTLKQKGLPMEAFEQNPGNMTAASQQLFDLLRTKTLKAYPDPDCRDHIKNAVAKDTGRGFRIIKDPSQTKARKGATKKPVDFAIALAMAAFLAIASGGVDTSQVIHIESPFGDISASTLEDPTQITLPFPLRT